MCNNCNIINQAFSCAKSYHMLPLYHLLKAMIERNQLEVYAGDCKFEDTLQVLQEETHYTVCFYLKCPICEEYYFFGNCIRGEPVYKRVKEIDKENLNKIWGKEGTYFQK